MGAFDRIAGYKKEKEELMALAEIFKNRKNTSSKERHFQKVSFFTVRLEQCEVLIDEFGGIKSNQNNTKTQTSA